jgi:protein-S-isoprenylcysteine O-methyltransferase Ste14
MTALRTILFMLFVPGLLIGILPIWLAQTTPAVFSFGALRWLAVPLWVSGLYRYVRNPIYLGVLAVLLGYVLWHPSLSILWMPVLVAISSYLFVFFYEEPQLRKTFGRDYEDYCKAVPRWIPKGRRLE